MVYFLLAIILVGVAGWVDAIGYIHFGGLFVSFMSGNTTVFAIHAGSGEWAEALSPVLAIAAFVFGAFIGAVVGNLASLWRLPCVLALETGLLGLAAALHSSVGEEAATFCAIATAMGVQNATLRAVGRAQVSLTYVTGSLVRFAEGLAAAATGKSTPREWTIYGLLWGALALGAVGGAISYTNAGFDALVVPLAALVGLLVLALSTTIFRIMAGKARRSRP